MTAGRHDLTANLLVEEGLARYSTGDVHGAAAAWADALALSPGHPQATRYLDHLRRRAEDGPGGPRDPLGDAAPRGDVDAGWSSPWLAAGGDGGGDGGGGPAVARDAGPAGGGPPDGGTEPGRDFDELTTGARFAARIGIEAEPIGDLLAELPEAGRAAFDGGQLTPGPDFTGEATDVRSRQLGFVQPAAEAPPRGLHRRARSGPIDVFSDLPAPRPGGAPPSARAAARSAPPATAGAAPGVDGEDDLDERVTVALPTLAEAAPRTDPRAAPRAPAALGARSGAGTLAGAPDDGDEEPTSRAEARHVQRAVVDALVPAEHAYAQGLVDELEAGAPAGETADERARRRLDLLVARASAAGARGELERAVVAAILALSEDASTAVAQKLLQRHRDLFVSIFQQHLGDLDAMPQLARPLHELASAPIGPRAAFLLSRVDGTMTIEEVVDVSGMPRVEAYRYLCQLFLQGILR